MNNRYPSLFISHGAPDIAISQHAAADALKALGRRFPQPAAIVIVSAHWVSEPVGITAVEAPETIHDFGGFPEALYRLQYPAKGDPQLAEAIASRLQNAGFDIDLERRRGLDHGAWMPLFLMYPEANIPVVQVALPAGGLQHCVRLGKALAPLRDAGVLLIGSGGSVHNLRALNREQSTAPWAGAFEEWLLQAVEGNHCDWLVEPARFPVDFNTAHPTIEHYLPLIFACAAGGEDSPGRRIHHSFMYGNIGMSCFEFGN